MELPEELRALGPNVIGATGGSGTRVVARIARRGGMFIGELLNDADDAKPLGAFVRRWINPYLEHRGTPSWPAYRSRMAADLASALHAHARPLYAEPKPWGWKVPRSIFLLPYFHEQFPQMKFVHVVRDGRDMAFSDRQGQQKHHGAAVLDSDEEHLSEPVRSIRVWSRVNLQAADYGERHMPGQYLRLRLEDVCSDPPAAVERLLGFLRLTGNPEEIARSEVARPDSLGRWRNEDSDVLDQLARAGEEGLRRFGYLEASEPAQLPPAPGLQAPPSAGCLESGPRLG